MVAMVGLVPIENDVILMALLVNIDLTMVLLVNMHLIEVT